MKTSSLLNIYNGDYAGTYNEKFLTNPFSKVSADFEQGILKGLIHDHTTWLDAGCGTGYFLGKFPGRRRAGLDLSPDMLAEAKKANPDALFFREGDFRIDIPEWHKKWSLVSCMWYPYSYLESIGEVETMLLNLAGWVQTGGELFIPVADLEDFRHETPPVPYEKNEEVYGGAIRITSYTWTWIENDGHTHVNMVAPHIEHVVQLLSPFFETIEIIRYPPYYEGWVSRKAILARNKRENPITGEEAGVIRHPVPPPANTSASAILHGPDVPVGSASHTELFRELFKRFRNGHIVRSAIGKLFK